VDDKAGGSADDEGLSAVRDGDSAGGEAVRTLHVADLISKKKTQRRRALSSAEKRKEKADPSSATADSG
jgi:hypothetical protein